MKQYVRNFVFDTKKKYLSPEGVYLEDHANKIVQLMRGNPVPVAETLGILVIVRNGYGTQFGTILYG